MPERSLRFIAISLLSMASCGAPSKSETSLPIEDVILQGKSDFYSVDFNIYKSRVDYLPVGVFDSGTGGLTVLNALLEYDEHTNQSKTKGADGVPDFRQEKFIYLADQANMPYGNYHSANKTSLLIEHIIKDTQFLLSNKYYPDAKSEHFNIDKEPVKVIVVACNTATAYGMENIRSFLKKSQSPIHVIGVIDAGAKGALDVFAESDSGSVGILATVGTIASRGYEKALRRLIENNGYYGKIDIFNQGGHGIAEAVDEEPDFVDRDARIPRQNYRGPSWNDPDYTIDKALLDVYNFNRDELLCDGKDGNDCDVLQLNSPENYMRFHLVSLVERIRTTDKAQPLKALILGCTHYPYLIKEIRQILNELYDYRHDGQYPYREVMSPEIEIVDPAKNVARELYSFLKKHELLNSAGDMLASEFYISVPNRTNPNVVTDSAGRFTYEYKYGRAAGQLQEYVKVVPFSSRTISRETFDRLKETVPATYEIITRFNRYSPKTVHLRDEMEVLVDQ
jgi:glutamate racemase